MTCTKCNASNPPDARFCMECGSPLSAACSECGTAAPAGARFCPQCGHRFSAPSPSPAPAPEPPRLTQYIPKELMEKLEAARSTGGMLGERRIVTMLFCDVQGSTAAAGQLDPEEWAEIMKGAFQYLIAPIYRYEGVLARLMGDAILAFFGAPIGHEDDPQRAVLAGLEILESIRPYRAEIRQKWGIEFDVRVGINTGLVVVGEMGSDLRVEYTAMGDAINLASRMEQTARPGTVQIAEATYKLVAPLFETASLGGITVKGKDEPVPAYQVLGLKAAPGRLRGIEGLDSPLIGRDAERQRLEGVLENLRSGCGQIVSVMAEAGLGKSRLVAEVHRAMTASGDPVAWWEGRALSFNTGTPYSIFADLFTRCFRLESVAGDAARYQAIEERVARVLPDGAGEVAPFIATLMGVGLTGDALGRTRYLEPPQVRERIFRAVTRLIGQAAANAPLVLVFEDLHWSDPTSLELIMELLPLAERSMLVLLAVFRPQRQEPSWRFHETAEREFAHLYTPIALRPLDEAESAELVGHLLQIEGLTPEFRRKILIKAEGNPFFVEEVIRSLLDAKLVVRDGPYWRATREIEQIALPDTLAGLLTARLDRLSEACRRVLQTAAVVGREFSLNLLAELVDAPEELDRILSDLQRRELIREKARIPERTFWFKHGLIQEAAYNSLLLSRRRELHKLVARRLEQRQPERIPEIARHFLEARESESALPYLVQAGERAARAYAAAEAVDWFQKAVELAGPDAHPSLLRRAYEGLGSVLSFMGDAGKAVHVYDEMEEFGSRCGDIPTRVSALNKASMLQLMQGEFPVAEEKITLAEQLARAHGDKPGLSEVSMVRCMMCTAAADFDSVLRYMGETIELGKQMETKEMIATGIEHVAATQLRLTRYGEAIESALEGLALARSEGARLHEAVFLATIIPHALVARGDLAGARGSAAEGLRIALEIGALVVEGEGSLALGHIDRMQGRYQEAIARYRRAAEAGAASSAPWTSSMALCALGSTLIEVSRTLLPQAVEVHADAAAILATPGGGLPGASAWAELGFCALAAGELDEAAEWFQRGLMQRTMTMNVERPRLLLGMAGVLLARGDAGGALHRVNLARDYAVEREMRHFLPAIALTEGRALHALGDREAALAVLRECEKLAAEMGMRPVLWQALRERAAVLEELGGNSDGESARSKAEEIMAVIAADLSDPDLRSAFLAEVSV